MGKHYRRDEMTTIIQGGCEIKVCPECINHKRGVEPEEALDCKNTYGEGDYNDGQCQCYSEEHGER